MAAVTSPTYRSFKTTIDMKLRCFFIIRFVFIIIYYVMLCYFTHTMTTELLLGTFKKIY